MSDTVTYYKGAMTLEDFREIVRSLQQQKPERIDPFDRIKYSPVLQAQIDACFHDAILKEVRENGVKI